ncbi:ATP-grasp fold amidoligase family protein [Gordonibacter pamelaeae]|uniref:ATP-grasp fold amidoligase family protein n=1 Tax=Gordonibacter pamelaeae TaxID=471189 RepID=UPI003A8FB057
MKLDKKTILKKAKYALRFLPDRAFIQLYYFARFRRFCDFDDPKTFNEKLQWLKLNDRNPLYITLVDKCEVKAWVAERIGSEHVVPTLGVWDSFDEIDFEALPERFVLKCTHDSEGVVVVSDRAQFGLEAAKAKIEAALKCNFYYIGREWPYLNVKPRIIAEEYMEDLRHGELRDYKFFCFDGEPKVMFVASGRGAGQTKFDYFDTHFNRFDIKQHYPNSEGEIERPETFGRMMDAARTLSRGIPHVRIDFYEVDGKMYFGECTFYHFSGFMPFEPDEWDEVFGSWLFLPADKSGEK